MLPYLASGRVKIAILWDRTAPNEASLRAHNPELACAGQTLPLCPAARCHRPQDVLQSGSIVVQRAEYVRTVEALKEIMRGQVCT